MSTTPTSTADRYSADRDRQALMTVGQLSGRTGLSRKAIRELEGRGLIYTVGRSDTGYRLFDESSLWCIRTIGELRGLGLTLAEIERLHSRYRAGGEQSLEVEFNEILDDVRARLSAQIASLHATIARIDTFRNSTDSAVGWDDDPCLTR